MNISLRQLEYVVEAARCHSVTGAARSLNISTSSILMAIDKFEQEFGIQLFVRRRSKGLSTTAAGKRVIARTIRLLDQASAFENDLGPLGPTVSGSIQIGCYSSISPNILPQIIHNMHRDYPDLTVHLHEGDILGIQDFLRSGAVDVLLTYDEGLGKEFDIEPFVKAPPHVVMATNDELANKDKISIREIAKRPLLLLNLPHSSKYVLSLFNRYEIQPNSIQKMETFEMTRSSAAAGLGLAILNIRPVIDETYSGLKVICKPIAEKMNTPRIVLATRHGGRTSRRTDIFARYCRDFFDTEAARDLFVG